VFDFVAVDFVVTTSASDCLGRLIPKIA